jgi:hypothetical protein
VPSDRVKTEWNTARDTKIDDDRDVPREGARSFPLWPTRPVDGSGVTRHRERPYVDACLVDAALSLPTHVAIVGGCAFVIWSGYRLEGASAKTLRQLGLALLLTVLAFLAFLVVALLR